MSERHVPADGQFGDPLAGPLPFPAAPGPSPARVWLRGIAAQSYLRHAVLGRVFGYEHIDPRDGECVVVGADPALSWAAFASELGDRAAVVDIRAAAAMAARDGCALSLVRERGSCAGAVQVFHRRMSADVYPAAPCVRVTADVPESSGFAAGDCFHFYHGSDGEPALHTIARDDALDAFAHAESMQTWAVSRESGNAALMTAATTRGGRITLMDLNAVDRLPEPSGVETLATHLFLSALGVTRPTFGKFVTACESYDAFVSVVRTLAARYPSLARVEPIGTSVGGRTLYVLKIQPDGCAAPASPASRRHTPDSPSVVLFTTCIHPLEWAPAYGVLRYCRFVLDACAQRGPSALAGRRLWWVLSACPDGWETRDQQPSGVNLNRNFPGSWERCLPGEQYWDACNGRFSPADSDPLTARGPAAGSQPETQALMRLLDEADAPAVTLADFHETTAPDSFLHQHESPDGAIPHLAWHCALVRRLARAFNGRFYANANVLAYRPGLSDFATYRFGPLRGLERLTPNDQCGWIGYALARGARALVVESAGSDCTHYQTIRRTEYAALAADCVLRADSQVY